MMRREGEERPQPRSLQSFPPHPSSSSSVANGRGGEKPWQLPTKRKFQHSVCEPLPLPPSSSFIRGLRASSKPLVSQRMVKSLSAPLKVYSDGDDEGCDNHHNQHTTPISLSGDTAEVEDMASIEYKRRPSVVAMVTSRERRRACCNKKESLKESTNIEPLAKISYKQGRPHSKFICSDTSDILALKEALRIERESTRLLREELDHERNASASAADEAMAMIARLQEEKASILMEARQFKRLADERELHNQEAISLLKEMVLHKEEEIIALEHELGTCRRTFFALEEGRLSGEDSNCPRYLKAEAESVGYGTCVSRFNNGFSRLLTSEQDTSSRDTWKSSRRNFKGLISDDIRSNLASCFNNAEELDEGDIDNKKLAIEWGIDMMSDRNTGCTTMYTALKNSSIASSGYGEDERDSTKIICDDESHLGKETWQSEPLQASDGKGQDSLVWDRIMRLEQRLETFRTDGEHHKTNPIENKQFSLQEITNSAGEEEVPEEVNHEEALIKEPFSTEFEHDETKRPTKLQCREGFLGYTVSRAPRESSPESRTVSEILGNNHVKGFISHEVPSTKDGCDTGAERVYDVYEIGNEGGRGFEEHCDGNSIREKKFPTNLSENPDLGPELTAPDLELMEVQSLGSQFTPETFMAKATNSGASLSRIEIQQLTSRLQALETERNCMNEAISKLRKENEDLKVLQNIAQELRQLRKTSDSFSEETQSDQSVYSLFRGFLSYLRCKSESGAKDLSVPSENPGFQPLPVKRAGLSFLLEKSPHLKTETMMVRGMKARVPHL